MKDDELFRASFSFLLTFGERRSTGDELLPRLLQDLHIMQNCKPIANKIISKMVPKTTFINLYVPKTSRRKP